MWRCESKIFDVSSSFKGLCREPAVLKDVDKGEMQAGKKLREVKNAKSNPFRVQGKNLQEEGTKTTKNRIRVSRKNLGLVGENVLSKPRKMVGSRKIIGAPYLRTFKKKTSWKA